MIMTTLAVLLIDPSQNFIRFLFGFSPAVLPLDEIREGLDWQFKTAMALNKNLLNELEFRARLEKG